MSDPFASLLLNGVKQIETRKTGVLSATGTGPCLLHIGRTLWPDQAYKEELWNLGIPEDKWEELTNPRPGFERGVIAGIVELGETTLGTEAELSDPETRLKVVARRENMGKFLTPVKRAEWLARPIQAGGRPGVWHTTVWRDALPPAFREGLLGLAEAQAREQDCWTPPEVRGQRPRLMVFDLDGCCWHPEMYQMTGGPPYKPLGDGRVVNSAGEEIRLLPAAKRAWLEIAEAAEWQGTALAVASSSYARLAAPLLESFEVRPGLSMSKVAGDLVEIYYNRNEGKRAHVAALQKKTGVPYSDMLFFDDDQGNIDTVGRLGVVCEHTPDGFTADALNSGLNRYAATASNSKKRR